MRINQNSTKKNLKTFMQLPPACITVVRAGSADLYRRTDAAGADRVIVQEMAVRQATRSLSPPPKGGAMSGRAHRICSRCALLSAGRRLDARAMLVAAAADAATLTLWRQPRVFVLATGDELSRPGLAGGGALSILDSAVARHRLAGD